MINVTLVSQVFLHEPDQEYDPSKPNFSVKQEMEIGDDNTMKACIPEANAYAVDVEAGARKKLKILAISVPDEPFEGTLHFALAADAPTDQRIDLSDSKVYTGQALFDLLEFKERLDTVYFWRCGCENPVEIKIFSGRDITPYASPAPTAMKKN